MIELSTKSSLSFEIVLVGLTVSLPRLCFNVTLLWNLILQNQSCKNLYKTNVVLYKKKKNNVYNPGEENVFIHVQIRYIQNKGLIIICCIAFRVLADVLFLQNVSFFFQIRFLLLTSVTLPTHISHPNVCENEKEAP